ncbi:MAG TPA: transglutaminase-like domain-containing protein [Bacteroidales bacterium]|nr:transglutaminase-like domain-containing protein [Bacteroidales bacterium]HPT02896.1 transglutaminase-like domain-containing protein [Bacteroidales bacterium]
MILSDDSMEFQALISLLDDPDPVAYNSVSKRIFDLGPPAVHVLEDVWEHSFDELVQSRIEQIVHHIQFEDIRKKLSEWSSREENDLLDGYCIITRFQYPDVDEVKLRDQVEKIRRDVWLELNDRLTALEIVKVFNHIFFEVHEFSQKTESGKIQDSGCYFLNNLLESRRGNSLSLGVLYVLLAEKLNLPVRGVDLPGHFVASYMRSPELPGEMPGILFYINPSARGAVFSRSDVELYLKQAGIGPEEKFFIPCSSKQIITRLLDDLKMMYDKQGDSEKASDLKALKKILQY